MVAGIACMQLVEQGKLSLDDADEVARFAPEVGRAKILKGFGNDGKPVLEEKTKGITLRMLLSHTGEFSSLFDPQEGGEIRHGRKTVLKKYSWIWIHLLQSRSKEVWLPSWIG